MIVGEAWGEQEERSLQPFMGVSGQELNRMLQEAGILRSEVYVSNLVNARPPNNDIGQWIAMKKKDITKAHVVMRDKMVLPIIVEGYEKLLKEIDLVQPNVVVPVGNSSLWALTGHWGVTKWRGSQLRLDRHQSPEMAASANQNIVGNPPKVIPTIHPAAVLREWAFRTTVVNDFRRIARNLSSREYSEPKWNFIVRPDFVQVIHILTQLVDRLDTADLEWIDFDLETKANHIDCAGIGWSRTDAICIPFMDKTNIEGYWSLEEEAAIVYWLWRLLCHPRVKVRGQNLLYDCQYTHRWWHFVPHVAQDTMITWHSCFSGMKKSLDFQASILCENYTQWKPDKAAWKEGG